MNEEGHLPQILNEPPLKFNRWLPGDLPLLSQSQTIGNLRNSPCNDSNWLTISVASTRVPTIVRRMRVFFSMIWKALYTQEYWREYWEIYLIIRSERWRIGVGVESHIRMDELERTSIKGQSTMVRTYLMRYEDRQWSNVGEETHLK